MAIPLSGIQHVGVPVRSMEDSLRFYREVFGVEPEFVTEAGGPDVSRSVGLPDVRMSIAFLHVGNTHLELLEYENPKGRPNDRQNCNVGAIHICFEVADIQAAWKELKAKGVKVATEDPIPLTEGAFA